MTFSGDGPGPWFPLVFPILFPIIFPMIFMMLRMSGMMPFGRGRHEMMMPPHEQPPTERPEQPSEEQPPTEPPLAIAERRYAAGEISREEFQRIREDLQAS